MPSLKTPAQKNSHRLKLMNESAFYSFRPRKDTPERNDQQTAFMNSRHGGLTILLGGNGSGKSALAVKKAVNFMIKNEPPRPDTPFWMVSDTFESTMTSVWVEKLYDKGHLPKQSIDWERIRWYKPNSNWPYEVPLKKTRASGYRNNWSIVMKSYDMGRRKFQGQSIGGFMFTEQFEHALLVETMRGCREKAFEHFKGNKICEFTPVDPQLSLWLQEMEENGDIPDDWGLYRSNTECAAEAGHVSMDWYKNQFLPMVPDSMIPARTQGLWSGYEGLIYPAFNPDIHCLPEEWNPPLGMHHRRMIDWGAGAFNAFVCLFGCFNGTGEWVIYDEYYSNDTTLDTIDHLKLISDMHPWPKSHPYYGVTWADPTSADRMRIASKLSDHAPGYDSLSVQGAANSVHEGIEHVSAMLKMQPSIGAGIPGRPRLMITKNCKNLIRELRMYQWMEQSLGGLNPQSARMEPKKIHDHACFPEGQMVDTPSGPKAIESLKFGDEIYTHLGIGRVDVGATITGFRPTVIVELDDGSIIECTEEHPLACGEFEWIRADESRGHSVNVRRQCWLRELDAANWLKSLNMADANGGDTQRASIQQAGISVDTSGKNGNSVTYCFISKFIGIVSEIFQKAIKSTTGMRSLPTTIHQIWNACRLKSILPSILKISGKPELLLLHGTGVRRASNGIGSMENQLGSIENRTLPFAANAELLLRQGMPAKQRGFAAVNVATGPEWNRGSMMSMSYADAADRSIRTVIDRRSFARQNVESVTVKNVAVQERQKTVYCISSSDGTMFVNGVLVSQCDALRYGLFSEASQSGITPTTIARQHSANRHGIQLSSSKFDRK